MFSSKPMRRSTWPASPVIDSPIWKRGKVSCSSTIGLSPSRRRNIAAVAPPGPPPIISTSVLIFILLTAILSRQRKKAISRVSGEILHHFKSRVRRNPISHHSTGMTERSSRHKEGLTFPACNRPRRIPSGPSCDSVQAKTLEEQYDLRLKVALTSSKKSEQWSRHDSSNESHDHEHGKDAL